ncbi:hypothetical protein BV25DRAFT_1993760 [Artomyces pyxidatus]|uniref:Uncharacterized protein n=1 Tax=Artomyces pyxidatus TaxID=48021 RepID=A0ACB8STK5_9AGAM|nr:hypothetical protein BV25DRAFT_1993760 [Artomyces pyxidatus]
MDTVLSEDAIAAMFNAKFASVAAGVIIVYDHSEHSFCSAPSSEDLMKTLKVITFDQEVNFIWKESWSSGKILFFVTRYYGLCATLFNNYALLSNTMTNTVGRYWILWQGWTGVFISVALAELVLVLRIRSLYLNDRTVTMILFAGFTVTMLAAAAIVGAALHDLPVNLITIAPHTFCTLGRLPPYLPTYFIPVIAFETLLGGLAAYKWLRDVGVRVRSWRFANALLRVLVRDSALYFLTMSMMYIVNAVIWVAAPDLLEVSLGFPLALSCVMIDRLILNLRAQHHRNAPRQSGVVSAVDRFDIEQQVVLDATPQATVLKQSPE